MWFLLVLEKLMFRLLPANGVLDRDVIYDGPEYIVDLISSAG